MSTTVQRVLIYRLGSLGDTVVALPALHLVARRFPDAERRMLTNFPVSSKAPPAAAVLGDSGLVTGYFRYTVGTRSLLRLARLWWELVRWRPQVLVYLGSARGVRSARRDAKFFRACGIWRQVGVPVNLEMQANLQQKDGALEPECERLGRVIGELGDARVWDSGAWDLHLNATELQTADEALRPAQQRPVMAVSVGTKVQAKDWGRENWQSLLRVLEACIRNLRSR